MEQREESGGNIRKKKSILGLSQEANIYRKYLGFQRRLTKAMQWGGPGCQYEGKSASERVRGIELNAYRKV